MTDHPNRSADSERDHPQRVLWHRLRGHFTDDQCDKIVSFAAPFMRDAAQSVGVTREDIASLLSEFFTGKQWLRNQAADAILARLAAQPPAAPVETPSYNLATGERDNEETDPTYFHCSAATGDDVSIRRDWLKHVIATLQGPLPSGRIGDVVFLLRDQLQDILDRPVTAAEPQGAPVSADANQEFERIIRSLIRNHSSPTIGMGDIHGGQAGYILYEPGLAFVVAGIKGHLSSATPTREQIARALAYEEWPLADAWERNRWEEKHWQEWLRHADAILSLSRPELGSGK